MFSAYAIMVPTVALTPPPDQAGANWLLRVTFLSLSPCFSIPLCLSLCLPVEYIWTSRGTAMSFHALKWLLVSNTPWGRFTISRHSTGETAICMHSMSWVVSYLGQKTRLCWLGCCDLKALVMQRVVAAGSTCPVGSGPISPGSAGRRRLLWALHCSWGMQWAAWYDSWVS